MTGDVHKLGEVLRAAREAKGVDLRASSGRRRSGSAYLSALERGDYRDLPGAVYTKGFLRNYGTYLGSIPSTSSTSPVWRPRRPRREAKRAARPPIRWRTPATRVRPHSGATSCRRSHGLVGGSSAYLGYELVNFARKPELRITQPAGNV